MKPDGGGGIAPQDIHEEKLGCSVAVFVLLAIVSIMVIIGFIVTMIISANTDTQPVRCTNCMDRAVIANPLDVSEDDCGHTTTGIMLCPSCEQWKGQGE